MSWPKLSTEKLNILKGFVSNICLADYCTEHAEHEIVEISIDPLIFEYTSNY